jgi:predicted ferric reductase
VRRTRASRSTSCSARAALSNRRARIVAVALLLLLPTVASAFSPLQEGRDATWIAGAVAGILALSLLVLQVLLPTPWLAGLDLPLHRLLGLGVAGLVIAHVGGLYLYSPDDVRDALVLAVPTHTRLGVLSAWTVLLSVGLALARRRLGLTYSDWQVLHAALAVLIVGTAVGHTVLVRGTLDGPAELLLCAAAVLATSAAAIYRLILRPLRQSQLSPLGR